MQHNVLRGLRKWKRDSLFQFVPIMSAGGVDWMTVSPQVLVGAVGEFLLPSRFRSEPEASVVLDSSMRLRDISDAIEDVDPSVESRILYLNGDLDAVITVEVRNYNPAVPLRDMSVKEFLQLIRRSVYAESYEDGGTKVSAGKEVF